MIRFIGVGRGRAVNRIINVGFALSIVAGFSACSDGGEPIAALMTQARDIQRSQSTAVFDPGLPIEAVPAAQCGPGSNPETGMQGQVSRADRASGRSLEGYSCNLERVAQYRHGEGASWQLDWFDECAYYGTLDNADRGTEPGAVVVDVSDPLNPVETALLQTPAMLDPHEALKVNEIRGLIAAVELSGGEDTGPPGEEYFDIYDISGDCAHPRLQASIPITGTTGHEGEWVPDGLTYYGSGGSLVNAIDTSDPTDPYLVQSIDWATHGLNFSDDGERAYLGNNAVPPTAALPNGATGLVVMDVSEIQRRIPDPRVKVISELYWADGAIAQHTIPFTSRGKSYLIFVEEGGRGTVRIIDISDERNPVIVSRLKLEVHLAQNAGLDVIDGGVPLFVYDAHYCSLDRQVNPTALACGYFESGVRVFDVRDVYLPREIAYYNPPPIPDEPLPGSSASGLWSGLVDHCAAQMRLIPERGELWAMCQDNEFQVLRFTNGVWPFK